MLFRSFDGVLLLSDLEGAIKAVEGVNDIVFHNVWARKNSDPLGSYKLVDNDLFMTRLWNTYSGYIVGETTGGSTLSDTLNFIGQ